MSTKLIIVLLLVIGVTSVLNKRRQRVVRRASVESGAKDLVGEWGQDDCDCGTVKKRFKPLAINRPDNRMLLRCPQCGKLWEEQIRLYGSKWRSVDPLYARDEYKYKPPSEEQAPHK
jgi:hypothetical protein